MRENVPLNRFGVHKSVDFLAVRLKNTDAENPFNQADFNQNSNLVSIFLVPLANRIAEDPEI